MALDHPHPHRDLYVLSHIERWNQRLSLDQHKSSSKVKRLESSTNNPRWINQLVLLVKCQYMCILGSGSESSSSSHDTPFIDSQSLMDDDRYFLSIWFWLFWGHSPFGMYIWYFIQFIAIFQMLSYFVYLLVCYFSFISKTYHILQMWISMFTFFFFLFRICGHNKVLLYLMEYYQSCIKTMLSYNLFIHLDVIIINYIIKLRYHKI